MKKNFNVGICGGKKCGTINASVLAVLITATFQFAFPSGAAERQVVHVHMPAATARLQPLEPLAGSQRLNLAIGLPLRNQEALANLLREIYDPASPNYHHYLTPEEFTARFGPSQQDYQAVIAFAKANDLTVTAEHPNRLLVDVNGSVADLERVLHVKMQVYRHPTENRTFYAPDVQPSLDLTVPILSISGLNNYSLPRPHFVAKPLVQGHAAMPNAGSGPGGTYMGKDFRAAYVPDTTLDGSGQVVGLLQFDGYTASDITYYENLAGLPNVTLTNVLIDGATGNPSGSGGEVEVSLDIEMVISMATNVSKVIVYEAPNPSPFVDILNRMATDDLAKQLSCSWYVPHGPAEPAAEQIWQEMAAQGQSFFNASGDNDAYTGLIDFPGDSTNITQVGGTTLTTSGAGGVWASETVWNWGGGIGSGGGVSTQYPIPYWQTNISMTASQGSTTMRNTPDVALTADNVYVRADGVNHNVGGTSCAAPLWAGFAALINQQAAATGEPAIGFINPAVDAIGSGPNYTTCFHDITTGNNTSPASPAKFYAVPGYDLCTGWGTPEGQKLINALANPEALQITPTTGFTSLGGVGGPFTVTSGNFSLTNVGTNTLAWTLSNTSLWLNTSVSSGTLAAGGPATNVVVSLNSVASNLAVGTYSATIWFTNLNDNAGQGRQFNLAVLSPPAITRQPTNQAVLDGATATFTAAATGGQPLYHQWQFNSNSLTDGGNISGSMTTNLTISPASLGDEGSYRIIVSNAAGVAVSSNALLTIISSKPVIVQEPADETVVEKGTARFSVAALGTKPFAYQWSFNTTNISGATNAILTLTNVQFDQAGAYAVVITNVYGSTQSSNANLTVLPCDPTPSGLVAWWPAEGNTQDIIGGNNGILENGAGFTNGEVGQAFYLNGINNFVVANAASPNWDVGQGSGFTIEGWIEPMDPTKSMLIAEYERVLATGSGADVGVQFGVNAFAPGDLDANIVDNGGGYHFLNAAGGTVSTGVWQHVALVYDKGSGVAAFYHNGVMVMQTNIGSFTPQTSFTNLVLGARTTFNSVSSPAAVFSGGMDEMSLYNRALSSNEIAAIYLAGSGGKCFTPTAPTITSQPTNQTVVVGQTATFSVTASGTAPLSYQWSFDTTNIAGATNATLVLPNVQLTNAGLYAVVVSNMVDSVLSSNATLTVIPPPPCDPSPAGLVSWWRAEGNALDEVSGNNGTLIGNATYGPGETGSAFVFDGSGSGVQVTNATNLQLQNLTIEGWIKRGSSTVISYGSGGNGVIFGYGTGGYLFFVNYTGNLIFCQLGGSTVVTGPAIMDTNWHHVAVTKMGSTIVFYLDGAAYPVPAYNVIFTFTTPVGIGYRPDNGDNSFLGTIDEISIYSRALTSNEIAAIYLAGSGGKCFTPTAPTITSQPTNQTVVVGQTATFSVTASGTAPLSYQWSFDTTNIAGATNATLVLPNVPLTNAGVYAVVVSNMVDSVLSSNATLTVIPLPPCDPAPSGLVAWWPAEGNADDIIGGNNGVLENGTGFTNGEVGQAFNLNGINQYVLINAVSSNLNVGLGSGLTIEGWIKPTSVANPTPLAEYERTLGSFNLADLGVHFYMTVYSIGDIYANVVDSSGGQHPFASGPNAVGTGVWQHVALTYEKASGLATIYVNGTVVVQANLGSFTPQTGFTNLLLGARTYYGSVTSPTDKFAGQMDEMSVYNRALSSNEIEAIYLAGSGGKCFTPTAPTITSQPTNQTVVVGQTATFSVTASGTAPLSYQWSFDTTNIAGATNATLVLPNVQLTNAGLYAVVVSNLVDSVLSSNAALTVLVPATITMQPTNQTVYVGGTASFSVIASGTPPYSYRWYFNQTNLVGATNATLVLSNVRSEEAGVYAVLVANPVNSILSSNAVLTVNLPPVLGVTQSGGFVLIYWPVSASGFVLEVSPSLSPVNWLPVSSPPIQIGNEYLESIQMTGTNQFYRLKFSD